MGVDRLDAGEAVTLTLFLAPPPAEAPMTYQRYITVTADGLSSPAVLAATVDVTTSNISDLTFDVTELGSTTALSRATVSLVNETGRVVSTPNGNELVYDTYQKTTDLSGRVLFDDIPVAEYSYVVRSDGYYAESALVDMQPLSEQEEAQASLGYTVVQAGYSSNGDLKTWGYDPSVSTSPQAQSTASGNHV